MKIKKKILIFLLLFLLIMPLASCKKDYSDRVVEEFDVIDKKIITKENPNFKILEADAIEKDGESYVFGKVENISEENFDLVSIEINIYDRNEEVIEEISDNIKNFKKQEIWNFKAVISKKNAYNFEIYELKE